MGYLTNFGTVLEIIQGGHNARHVMDGIYQQKYALSRRASFIAQRRYNGQPPPRGMGDNFAFQDERLKDNWVESQLLDLKNQEKELDQQLESFKAVGLAKGNQIQEMRGYVAEGLKTKNAYA